MIDHAGRPNFTPQKTKGDVGVPVCRALPDIVDPDDLDMVISCLDVRNLRPMWLTTAYGASQWFAKKGAKG